MNDDDRARPFGTPALDVDVHDHLRLDAHMRVTTGIVVDRLANRVHPVNGTAEHASRLLERGGRLGEMVTDYADRFAISRATAQRDMVAIAAAYDGSGLLVVRRSWRTMLGAASFMAKAWNLDWPDPSARRYRPTAAGLARAVFRSYRLSLLGALLVSALLMTVLLASHASSGVEQASLARAASFGATPLLIMFFLVSQVAVHELGHLAAAGRVGTTRFLVVRGPRLFVAHSATMARDLRRIALAGPVAGLLWGGGLAAVAASMGAPAVVVALMAAVTAPHLWSLLPWSSDGRCIWPSPRRDAR